MAFGTLEDLEGAFELVIFAEPFARLRALLKEAHRAGGGAGPLPLLVSGTLEASDPPKLLVRDAIRLTEAAREALGAAARPRARPRGDPRPAARARAACSRPTAATAGVRPPPRDPGRERDGASGSRSRRGVEPSDGLLRAVDGLFGRPVADRVL